MTELIEKVDAPRGGLRLDTFWQNILEDEGVARARVQDWIRDGRARVGGQVCRKPSTRLTPGQTVSLEPEEVQSAIVPESGKLTVLHADEHVVVINKDAGLTVHPAPSVNGVTLVHQVAHAYPALLSQSGERPGVVHRLDKETSGLIVMALSDPARLALTRAFSQREVYKEYLALVSGVPKEYGRIMFPLGRHPSIKTRMAVVEGGRPAESEYRVLWVAADRSAALVRVRIHTGRTHQIRVHMAAIGHPLLGDRVYADAVTAARAPRQMLHAWQLRLDHPLLDEELSFLAPPPPDFMDCVRELSRAPLRIGLTGAAGSGKSTVRRMIEEQGVPVFCADQVVAQSYTPGADGWVILRHHFGDKFVPAEDQPVDKAAVYTAMHESESLRREIERLIHPVVRHKLREFQQAHHLALNVAEIPLLCEAGLGSEIDLLVVVSAPHAVRHARLGERGWDAERIARVDSWQWPQERKVRMAQLVVDNSGSLDDLRRKSVAVLSILRGIEAHRISRQMRALEDVLTHPSTIDEPFEEE